MNHAKLLDCTLRDGGYLVDKNFGSNAIQGIVKGLFSARVDIIEIGFLQDDGSADGKTVFLNSDDAKKYIPGKRGDISFVVLADYSRYSIDNLEDYDGTSFDGVRACFFKQERYDVIHFCKEIKRKGYKLFVQPVDILGYDDKELIELIEMVNEIEPYAFSIVDTFGSMYMDDLHRIYSLIHHNLVSTACVGFHSHNNMQMSSALSQEFLKITYGQRRVIVDTTLCGMGRGAGNTPTELIAQYMVDKLEYNYDLDQILDVIDNYMDNIKSRCDWGYSIPYFIAGCYSAHVNNITYLMQKNTIGSKDIRYILNKVGYETRKRYNYELLENTYIDYVDSDIDDNDAVKSLEHILLHKNIVIVAPGKTVSQNYDKINEYITKNNAIVLMVNFISDYIKPDYLYFSNIQRYKYWVNDKRFNNYNKIITSNIQQEEQGHIVVSFARLIKCGWENLDNSVMMLLRLLDLFNLETIALAGFDGYDFQSKNNYVDSEMELARVCNDAIERNKEIMEMLEDHFKTRNKKTPILFITESRFSNC